jgi:hypothetical protein
MQNHAGDLVRRGDVAIVQVFCTFSFYPFNGAACFGKSLPVLLSTRKAISVAGISRRPTV